MSPNMTTTSNKFNLSIISDEEIEAQNLVELGEIDQAIAIYQRLKPDSGRILHLLGLLCAEKKGDFHSAINYYQQALEIQEENGEDVSNTLTELGFAYQNLCEFDLALFYHLRALRLRESIENVDKKAMASTLLGLANAYWGQHDLSQALIYAQRALTLNQSVRCGNDPHLAANLAVIANIYHHSGDDTRALESAKQALLILEGCSSSHSASLVILLNNMGTIQLSAGLFSNALLTFIRILHIYQRTLPEGHQTRVIIENNIQRITEMQENNIMNLFSDFSKVLSKLLLL